MGKLNQKPSSMYSMTSKQLIPKCPYPSVQSVVQDVSLLNREGLLEIRAIIDRLLAAPVNQSAQAPQHQPIQASSQAEQQKIEFLALLRQGIIIWNEWRERNPEINPDLTSVNLSGANLAFANLSGVNLEFADSTLR